MTIIHTVNDVPQNWNSVYIKGKGENEITVGKSV